MIMIKTRAAYTALQEALGEVKTLGKAYDQKIRENKTPEVRLLVENMNLAIVESKIKDVIEYYRRNIEIT